MKKITIFFLLLFLQNSIAQCPGGLVITSQAELNNLSNYIGCTTFTGYIDISGDEIYSLEPLSQLTSIAILNVHDVPNLNSWSGTNFLTYIGDLQISGDVPEINNFSTVTTIGNLIIQNSTITSIQGFDSLSNVGGMFRIFNNINLEEISAFSFVTSIGSSINGGGLFIGYNQNLNYIIGFNILNTAFSLDISGNESLTNLNCFDSLTSITNGLTIHLNPNLTSISSLDSLVYVDGFLQIYDNLNLTSLYGIQNVNLDFVDNLVITQMPNLTSCAFPNICNYLSNNGVNTIDGNGGECADLNAFLNSCSLDTENFNLVRILAYPNPVKNYLTVENFNGINIKIVNQLGQIMKTNLQQFNNKLVIDFSAFEIGIYVISFEDGTETKSIKILKN